MCFFVDKIGRRPLFLIATTGMLASFVIWTICSARYAIAGNKAAANGVVGMIYIYYTFYNLAWSGLLVGYTVEILPYHIRAKGMTIVWLSVDIALFFNQYVNPIALGKISWKYYIFYCVWLAFELVVVYIVSFLLLRAAANFWISCMLTTRPSSSSRQRTHPSRKSQSTLTAKTPLWVVLPRLTRGCSSHVRRVSTTLFAARRLREGTRR